MTRSERMLAGALFLLFFAQVPAIGQVCFLPKYERTLACVPTLTAIAGTTDYEVQYQNGNSGLYVVGSGSPLRIGGSVPLATPFGFAAQFASQIASAPSAATSVGFTLSFQGGAPTLRPADLGPLFSDLPQTIGRHRLYVGASYQFVQFTRIGGQNIKSFGFSQYFANEYFSEQNNPYIGANGEYLVNAPNAPLFGTNQLHSAASLKIHEVNTYVSFGVTDRLEVSAVIPFSKVLFSINTACSSVDPTYTFTHANSPDTTFCGLQSPTPQVDLNHLNPLNWYGLILTAPASSSTVNEPNATEINAGPEGILTTAKGLGDLTLRAKYEFLKREHDGLAAGMEFRAPTGDPLNFKGSGAFGYRTFLAYAYSARFSPHINIGYQYNGSSVNDVRDTVTYSNVPGTVANPNYNQGLLVYADKLTPTKLPNIFSTTVGLDFAATRRINVDFDLLERAFSNDGIKAYAPPTVPSGVTLVGAQTIQPFTGTNDKVTLIFGSKFKLVNHLLLAANLMVDANPGSGLSYKPSPLVSLSYDFGVTQK